MGVLERLLSSITASSCYCCGHGRLRTRTAAVKRLALLLLLSHLVQPSMQVAEFLREPEEYYYVRPNQILFIPCVAVQVTPGGDTVPLNTTFFVNSKMINIYSPPPSHHIVIDRSHNVIGLILALRIRDNPVYHCQVENVLVSRSSTVYIGDGLPLSPVSPPVQISETIYSVSIAWGFSPTPTDAPLLGYRISVLPSGRSPADAIIITTDSNDTEIDLLHLLPGSNYSVTVAGVSHLGNGTSSPPVIVTTVVASPPPPPANVKAHLSGGIVSISWEPVEIEVDVMPPLQYYLITYGREGSTYKLATTARNTTTDYKLFIQDKTLRVGVASHNSVGRSQFTFTAVTTTDDLRSLELVILLVTSGVVLLLSCVLCVVIIMCVFCHKTRSLSASCNLAAQGSPASKRSSLRDNHSLKLDSEDLKSSYLSGELQEYLSEPRKAGSPPPDYQPFI